MFASGSLEPISSCSVTPKSESSYTTTSSAYLWTRIILLQLLPAVVLAFCNISLIKTTLNSYTYRKNLIGAIGKIAQVNASFCSEEVSTNNSCSVNADHESFSMQEFKQNSELNASVENEKTVGQHSICFNATDNDDCCTKTISKCTVNFSSSTKNDLDFPVETRTYEDEMNGKVFSNKIHANQVLHEPTASQEAQVMDNTAIEENKSDIPFEEHDQITSVIVHESSTNNTIINNEIKISAIFTSYDNENHTNKEVAIISQNGIMETSLSINSNQSCNPNASVQGTCQPTISTADPTTKGDTFVSSANRNIVINTDLDIEQNLNQLQNVNPAIANNQRGHNSSYRRDSEPCKLNCDKSKTTRGNNQRGPNSAYRRASAPYVLNCDRTSKLTRKISQRGPNSAYSRRGSNLQLAYRSELRSSIMLVLVTSCTLLAELYVATALTLVFIVRVASPDALSIDADQLSLFVLSSNMVTLCTFPLNFIFFCGLSSRFRSILSQTLTSVCRPLRNYHSNKTKT